ncbi:FG-GAP repeat domain-containing protein [Kitasatospora sp. NPDC018058]|uniref:FG-GAP repeat domain-containing protein n=1 Tax=Kitasatospora sp. NPDC018058 TaxID=3364025 RepID=UPI0037BF2394
MFLYPGSIETKSDGTKVYHLGASQPLLPAGSWSDVLDVTAGHFTADKADGVVIRRADGRATVLRSTGSGLTPVTPDLRPAGASGWTDAVDVTAGNFTGHPDGTADLLVRWTAGSASVYPGKGDGTFGASVPVTAPSQWVHNPETWLPWKPVYDITAGDFNGDKVADIVARWSSGTMMLFQGDGRGGFLGGKLIGSPGAWRDAASVTGGDFNGDGRRDLLVRWNAGSAFLYPGNGAGTFGGSVPVEPAGTWSGAMDVTAADLDNDGIDDVVVRWPDHRIERWIGSPTGFGPAFELVPGIAGATDPGSVMTAADFTGDGNADLLIRECDGSAHVYAGDGQGGIGATSIPWKAAPQWSDLVDQARGSFLSGGGTQTVYRYDDGSMVLDNPAVTFTPGREQAITVRSGDGSGRVDHFLYAVDAPVTATGTARVDAVRNTAGIPITPTSAGSHVLSVVAVDPAGHQSTATQYTFTVSGS